MAFQVVGRSAVYLFGLASHTDLFLGARTATPIESYPIRAVAQLGSALVWGTRGRGFKSRQPDQIDKYTVYVRERSKSHED